MMSIVECPVCHLRFAFQAELDGHVVTDHQWHALTRSAHEVTAERTSSPKPAAGDPTPTGGES